jgi:hypothetical protein
MPFIPLKEKPYKNVDSVGNSVAIEDFNDCDKDDFFNNKRRKGLLEFVDLGTGVQVDGIFNPIDSGVVAAFSAGKLFKVLEDGSATEITGVTINAGTPVKSADFSSQGFYCNISKIMKWVYTDATCSLLTDPSAPTNASHLGFIDQYLLALRYNSQRYDWSDTGTPDQWLGEFASAEARPDKLVALISAFGDIFLPGTRTIELHSTSLDPSAPFQRRDGTTAESGSLSPYSFAQVDNSYMFLDENRRVIRMRGNDPQVISNPFDKEFQSLQSIEDAIGIHFNAEGDAKYIITFPASNKTFVYDYKLDFWSRWSLWDSVKSVRNRWIGNCGVLVPGWNKYLVGSKDDGKIYEASADYTDDDGNSMESEIITGRIDWGTSRRKVCKALRVKVKRGTGGLATNPTLTINYRDDGNTEWKPDKVIKLGKAGDEYTFKSFKLLGSYRSRQWRFRISTGELLLVSAEENYRVI